MLTAVVFLPLVGAVLLALLVKGDQRIRIFAALVTLVNLGLSIVVFALFDSGDGGFQLKDKIAWIGDGSFFNNQTFEASYHLGVDGLSAPMVLLTGLLGFCGVLASWSIKTRVKEYFVWFLVLQTAVMGVFTALDLLLFFLFWELELLPMFLLISIWGTGRKEYSAMKFLIFTIAGSAFMLVSICGHLPYSGGGHLRHDGVGCIGRRCSQLRHPHQCDFLVLCGLLCYKAARLARPHLAPRRPHRCPDGGECDARWRSPENGRIRAYPDLRRDVPRS